MAPSTDPAVDPGTDRRGRPVVERLLVTGPAVSTRRLAAVVGLFFALIGAIVGYNANATSRERDQALVVNVASRQRALAERYLSDVLVVRNGGNADPTDDGAMLLHTADALLRGGTVLAVKGADQTIHIPPVS